MKQFEIESGGERGIRTPGPVTVNGFQDRRIRPLCHLSNGVQKYAIRMSFAKSNEKVFDSIPKPLLITPIHLNINTIPIALSLVHNLTHKHQHVSDATNYHHKNGLIISPSLLECQYRAVANSQRLPQTHHQKRRYPETQTQYTKSGHPQAPVTRNT